MPNIKSAKKRMRLSRMANERNRAARSRLRTAIKQVHQAENAERAEAAYRRAQILLDRAATSKLLHPSTTARMKSNLARKVAAMG